MTRSITKLSEVEQALPKKKQNFKILNDAEDSVIITHESTKASDEAIDESSKRCRENFRSSNEGEVCHWSLLNHENVETLIDISSVRDDLVYTYFTNDHGIILKYNAHDQNFIYKNRCFDRERLYANGICSGFNYLHEISKSLMNYCDDFTFISKVDDRANIDNFDHLICEQKIERSWLNIPEICMAPETKESEFDSITAKIEANGTIMFDMDLAHLVLWAIIDSKPVKAINREDNLSLDLLQTANGGSVVAEIDFTGFMKFLKHFLTQNSQEKMLVKYTYIASFLQNISRYKVYRDDSCQSLSLPEDSLSLDFYNPNFPTCCNPVHNFCLNSISPIAQIRKIESVYVGTNTSIIETQQVDRQVLFGENETKVEIFRRRSLKNNIKLENLKLSTKMPLLPIYKTVASIANAKTTEKFQNFSKNWEAVNADTKTAIHSSSDYYQSKSSTPVKSRTFYNTVPFKKFTSYSNNKHLSADQSVECDFLNTDIGLNHSYNNNYDVDDDDESDNSKDGGSSVTESSDCEKVETVKRLSKIAKTCQLQNETKIKQHIPSQKQYDAPLQTFERFEVKPPSNSEASHIFLSPEIESVINKITFLRRCYVSIQGHQKGFISDEFSKVQSQFIKKYKDFLYLEELRLCEMLMVKYELKLEDVTQLMKYVDFGMVRGNQCKIPMNDNFFDISGNNFLQTQGIEDDLKDNVECFPCDQFEQKNRFILRPACSYCKAIENAEKNINNKTENENTRTGSKIINPEPENKMECELLSHKISKENHIGFKMKEMVVEHETMEENAKAIDEEQNNTGTHPKRVKHKNDIPKEKRKEIKTIVTATKSPNESDKNKVKGETEIKSINKKLIDKTVEMNSYDEKKINEHLEKKEKNICEHKNVEKPKRSWFFSWFQHLDMPWWKN